MANTTWGFDDLGGTFTCLGMQHHWLVTCGWTTRADVEDLQDLVRRWLGHFSSFHGLRVTVHPSLPFGVIEKRDEGKDTLAPLCGCETHQWTLNLFLKCVNANAKANNNTSILQRLVRHKLKTLYPLLDMCQIFFVLIFLYHKMDLNKTSLPWGWGFLQRVRVLINIYM